MSGRRATPWRRRDRALGLKAIRLSLIGGATGVPEPRPVYLTRMVIRLTDAAGIPHDIAFRQEVVGLEPRPQRLASFGLLGRDCLAGMRFVYDGPSGAFALLRDGEPES